MKDNLQTKMDNKPEIEVRGIYHYLKTKSRTPNEEKIFRAAKNTIQGWVNEVKWSEK